jgi:hypothetical protein
MHETTFCTRYLTTRKYPQQQRLIAVNGLLQVDKLTVRETNMQEKLVKVSMYKQINKTKH